MAGTAPVRSVITGGPGTGKSSLLEVIARTAIQTFPEVARAVLKEPGGMAMRAERPADFAAAMYEAELEAWHAAKPGASLYDRGFPDIVGFLELEGLPISDALDQACFELHYSGPIFRAPPWREIYLPDEERIQDWEQAVSSDTAVSSAWVRYGYELIDLPRDSIAVRAAFVTEHLKASLAS